MGISAFPRIESNVSFLPRQFHSEVACRSFNSVRSDISNRFSVSSLFHQPLRCSPLSTIAICATVWKQSYHRIAALSAAQSEGGHFARVLPRPLPFSRALSHPFALEPSTNTHACIETHVRRGHGNTSVKLLDTRITDRTLHSDGNYAASFAR